MRIMSLFVSNWKKNQFVRINRVFNFTSFATATRIAPHDPATLYLYMFTCTQQISLGKPNCCNPRNCLPRVFLLDRTDVNIFCSFVRRNRAPRFREISRKLSEFQRICPKSAEGSQGRTKLSEFYRSYPRTAKRDSIYRLYHCNS